MVGRKKKGRKVLDKVLQQEIPKTKIPKSKITKSKIPKSKTAKLLKKTKKPAASKPIEQSLSTIEKWANAEISKSKNPRQKVPKQQKEPITKISNTKIPKSKIPKQKIKDLKKSEIKKAVLVNNKTPKKQLIPKPRKNMLKSTESVQSKRIVKRQQSKSQKKLAKTQLKHQQKSSNKTLQPQQQKTKSKKPVQVPSRYTEKITSSGLPNELPSKRKELVAKKARKAPKGKKLKAKIPREQQPIRHKNPRQKFPKD